MHKKERYFALFSLLLFLLSLYSVSAINLFSEDFGTGNDWTTDLPVGWTPSDDATSGMDDQQSITGGSDGNRYAWLVGNTVEELITTPEIDTSSKQNIILSFDYNLFGTFAQGSEFLIVGWVEVGNGNSGNIYKATGISGWNHVEIVLPSEAENTSIKINFKAPSDNDVNDYIFIDNVNVNADDIPTCGNNVVEGNEQCDDGANGNDFDQCYDDCTFSICGDGNLQQPNGQGNAGENNDGIESCDDGNLIDDDGPGEDTCDNNCRSTTSGTCGEGDVDAGEQCDDSNTQDGDGCDSSCQLEVQAVCGNSIIEFGEQCDDGNINNNDACKNDCTFNVCGDNVIETGVEECDDGNTVGGDGCSSTCQLESICGNGLQEAGEGCDDGNTIPGDGCSSTCQIEGINQTQPSCGNGNLDLGEECDDNNNIDGDGCSAVCLIELCGDGITQSGLGEQCDDGNFNNHDNCLNTCQNPSCGDGFLFIGPGSTEQCDDGNNDNGDGCNAQCNFEPADQCFQPVDVMLVIDRSSSMSGQPLVDAKAAAITFLGEVNFSKDKVGLASFSTSATLDQQLTNNEATVTAAINALVANGATNIGGGIKVGREELVANGGDTKVMILLSDGAPNVRTLPNGSLEFCFGVDVPTACTQYAIDESTLTKNAGIEIFTIGLGVTNFTKELLKEIATNESNFFFAPTSSNLEAIYLQIAQEICPCGGFDCSINSDQCNIGFCNVQTDQCEFNPQPQSTTCEEDNDLCTVQHCDGQGACVINDTVDVPPDEACTSFFCNSDTGNIDSIFLPESTPCENDQNLCTTQHCNGAGSCIVNDTVDVPPAEACRDFLCDPQDGQIKPNDFALSTPCETDQDLCTTQHCDGAGLCVVNDTVVVPPDDICESFFCDPSDGQIKSDPFSLSTPCEADQNLCTIDHCDGSGICVQDTVVDCSNLDGQCQDGVCNSQTGLCEADFDDFPESTLCETDDNICTIQHCDGLGSCVINPEGELPEACVAEVIKDAKVAQALPTSNFGLGRYMIVNPKTGAIDRSYLRIDSSLLTNPVLTANLKIWVYYTGGSATGTDIEAFYCRDHDFIETTINWNNQPLNEDCSLADVFTVPSEVVAGIPETFHEFDLLNETNFEIANGDGLFTIVLKSAEENTGVSDNSKYVQYLTKEYSEAEFRPKFEIS